MFRPRGVYIASQGAIGADLGGLRRQRRITGGRKKGHTKAVSGPKARLGVLGRG
jgi:hypothetical protein